MLRLGLAGKSSHGLLLFLQVDSLPKKLLLGVAVTYIALVVILPFLNVFLQVRHAGISSFVVVYSIVVEGMAVAAGTASGKQLGVTSVRMTGEEDGWCKLRGRREERRQD